MFENNIEIIINIFIILIGLIIGILLGYYFFKKYKYKGPDSNEISKKIYTDFLGNKYKWIPKVCVCPISYSMIKLHDPNYIDPDH